MGIKSSGGGDGSCYAKEETILIRSHAVVNGISPISPGNISFGVTSFSAKLEPFVGFCSSFADFEQDKCLSLPGKSLSTCQSLSKLLPSPRA